MIDRYITENPSIRKLVWAFDIRRDPDVLDTTVLDWIRFNHLPFCLVLTKSDKEGRGFGMVKKEAFQKKFETNDVFLFSAKDGNGKKELLSHLILSLEDQDNYI